MEKVAGHPLGRLRLSRAADRVYESVPAQDGRVGYFAAQPNHYRGQEAIAPAGPLQTSEYISVGRRTRVTQSASKYLVTSAVRFSVVSGERVHVACGRYQRNRALDNFVDHARIAEEFTTQVDEFLRFVAGKVIVGAL